MKNGTTKLYNWAIEKASSPKSTLWLALLFSLELILLIPLDAVMMFFCLQKRSHILLYIFIATLASTLSGLIGYLIGHFLWDLIGNWVVPHLISTSTFTNLSNHLQDYESLAVLFGGFAPFPLKALSLAAGVFHLGALSFISYLAIARLARFAIIGATMAMWGKKVKVFVDKYFHHIFLLVGAKIAAGILFFWAIA